tara:strand:- start:864 stop:2057 length:1194 start_codon:yes stop_codon:yes gene_type:complete
MAINSNFSIYEPEAFVEVALANQYPNRPMVSKAVTNVAGASIEGLVAARNKTVSITRAVKPTGAPSAYSGSYSLGTPNASEEQLVINKHYYAGFSIDKADQKFALPDLVQQHFVPRLHQLIDQINSDVKVEARKAFEVAFADNNTDSTVMDANDLAEARKIMASRKFTTDNLMMVIDPFVEKDLTTLNIFQQADQRGSADIQLGGSMARAYGFDFFVDNEGSDHTPATVTDATIAATEAIGQTELTIDNGSGSAATVSLAEGDIVTFGSAKGTDDFYTVESQTGTVLTIKEPLRKALANNATINPVDIASGDTGREQFFYDPSALALVTAVMPSVDSGSGSGVRRAAGFEPMNNVNYTLTIEETKSGADVLIEVLYGAKVFRPDLGGRYIRGNVAKA